MEMFEEKADMLEGKLKETEEKLFKATSEVEISEKKNTRLQDNVKEM